MQTFLIQDWTTIRGLATGVTSITQPASAWLDLAGFGDAIFWLQVAETSTPSGTVYLNLETSPSRDDALFIPLTPGIPLPLSFTPTVARATQNPLARFVRWRLSTTANTSGAWDATFRIWVAANVATAFTPTQLSGCKLWLRADQGVVLNGSTVSRWIDLSGNGNDATQSTPADQPAYQATGWPGGKPALSWSGAAGMVLATGSISLGAMSVCAAYKMSAVGYLAVFNSDAGGATSGAYLWGSVANTMIQDRGGTASAKNYSTSWAIDNVAHTVAWTFDGTHAGHLLYRDGTAVTLSDATIGNPGTSPMSGPFYVGANQTGGGATTGLLPEIIVFDHALSATELALVHAYQAAFWGTP